MIGWSSATAGLEVLDAPSPSDVGPAVALARGLGVALGVVVLALLAGCARTDECRLASDCPARQFCVQGLCVAECREDRDCEDGEACRAGRCQAREARERLCASALDCEVGETCSAGVCQVVRFVGDAGAGGQPTDAGTSTPDGGSGVDAGPVGLPYGAVCAAASECASNLCLGPTGEDTGRCTRTCGADTDCAYPDRCLEIPGAGRLCAQEATGLPVGAPCPNGPETCASGLCVDAQDGSGPVCTQQCAPLPGCPPNLTCQPVPDGTGGAVAVCIPGQGRGFGEACSAARECATQLCVGSGSSGVCTSLCSQVPCPTGWACTLANDGSGNDFRVCAPEGAAGGGFGAACTGASGCQSGLCLHDARTGSAFCTAYCSSSAECTGVAGLACVSLANGARVCGPI